VTLATTDAERAEALFGAAQALRNIKRQVGGGRFKTARTEYGDWYGAQSRYRRILQLKDLPNETKLKAGAAIFEAPSDKLSDPLSVFTTILALPTLTPEDKADWLLRRGQYYFSLLLTTSFPSPQAMHQTATLALTDFTAVTVMEQISDGKKAEAWLEAGEIHTGLKALNNAVLSYANVLPLPKATDEQKAKALIKTAELQAHLNNPTEAIASLKQVFALKSVVAGIKVTVHKMLATAYLNQKNLPAATAELGKISAIPDLTGYAKVSALEESGDLLLNANVPAAARAEFEKALAVPPTEKSRIAYLHMKIGKTFFAEKNYPRARTTLQTAVGIEGASSSYKEEAWQVLGDVLTQEKNYAAAIEAYQKVTADPKTSVFIKISAALGLGQAAKLAGNFDQAAAAYDLALSNYFSTSMSPLQTNIVRTNKQAVFAVIQNVAVEFSKTAASHNAALTIFRSFLKNAKYNDAELATIYLAWGDVLAQQNKLEEAVKMYQKIPATQPQYQEALKKRQELTAKLNANGNPQ
jgi:tetratricopeptide (TPR) repeat protein